MSYFARLTQAVTTPSGLTSTANINAGATWTSTTESTLEVAGIQVMWFADQNCTIYVDQGPDGSNLHITDRFIGYAGTGNGWTIQAVGAVVRIRVTNNGSSATTDTHITTALCPIVEAVPRALSTEGNLKVGVYEIEGATGSKVQVTPMNSLRVAESVRLAGSALFGPTGGTSQALDSAYWVTSAVGTGASTLTGGRAVLSTGTTSASSVLVQSVRIARYIGTNMNFFRGVVQCPAATGTNTRRWGAGDLVNGFFLEYVNGTGLALVCRKNSSDANRVASGSFNGHLGITYDPSTTSHTYEIQWTNSKAWFFVDGELLHTFSGDSAPLTETLHHRVFLQNVNGANVNNNTLEVRTASIARVGHLETQKTHQTLTAQGSYILKTGPGNLSAVNLNTTSNLTCVVTIYDNVAATGTPIATITAQQANNQSAPFSQPFFGLPFVNGLYAVVAGALTTPNVSIIYE